MTSGHSIWFHESPGGQQHHADFKEFHGTRDLSLFILVGNLSASSRKQEEGQDEKAGQQGRQCFAIHVRKPTRMEGNQCNQRRLENIVIERAQKLGEKERAKALLAHQLELVAHIFMLSHTPEYRRLST